MKVCPGIKRFRYKRELIEKEKEVEDFLEKFYSTKNPDFR
jgi:hypothetical protein